MKVQVIGMLICCPCTAAAAGVVVAAGNDVTKVQGWFAAVASAPSAMDAVKPDTGPL